MDEELGEFEPSLSLPVEVILSENIEDSESKLKTIPCLECDKLFKSQSNLNLHVKRVHQEVKNYICDKCPKSFETSKDFTVHKLLHKGEKNFPCNICGKSYQTKDYLIIHTRIHTGEKPYFCELCGKSFSDPSSFKQHEKQHSNTNTNIPCEICGKSFKREKNLKLHMLVHSENHSKNASDVDTLGARMVFSNEFKLNALKKVQEIGQRETSKLMKIPYTTLRNWVNVCKKEHNCQFCGRSFPFKASLERHEKLKHGEISPKANFNKIKYDAGFKTEVAEFAVANSTEAAMKKYDLADSTIRRWIKVTKAPIICTICGRTCAYKRELERHMVEVHNAENIIETIVEKPLHDFLANSGEHISFDKKVESNSPILHGTQHLAFFNQIINKYSGTQLTQILGKIRSFSEIELERFIESHKRSDVDTLLTLFPTDDDHLEMSHHDEEKNTEACPSSQTTERKEPIVLKIKKEDIFPSAVKEEIDSSFEDESDLGSDYDESDYGENIEDIKHEDDSFDYKDENDQPYIKIEDGEEAKELSHLEVEDGVQNESSPINNGTKRVLPCEVCGKTFKAPCDLKRHLVKHTGEKAFSCQICGALFAHQHGVDRHMKIHANKRPFICSFCNKGFNQKTSLVDHERGHTGEKPYQCDECDEMFARKSKILNHKVHHHNAPKPYTCEECGKGFMRSNEIVAHKRTHTGEKPYTCERCGDCFTFIGGLKKHKRRHDIQDGILSIEDKRVECTQCGKAFYTKANLERHMKSHFGIKDFQCVNCGKQYSSERSLQQHVAIVHHGQRGFECQECGKSFTRVTSLKVHRLTHTNETPYRCEFCTQGYKEKRNLMKHIERQHPTETYNIEQMHPGSVSENSEPSTERDMGLNNEDMTKGSTENLGVRLSFAGIPPPFSLNQMLIEKSTQGSQD